MKRPPTPQPNILLVLTDQQRADTIQALGSSFEAKTPVMDALVREGTAFTQCCCTAPVCGPSRSTLVTGRYPLTAGMESNLYAPCPPLSRQFDTIGDLMQRAGYETVYHGKWHLGGDIRQYGFEHAEESSFDEDTRRMASRYWRDRDWGAFHRPFFHVVSFMDPHDHYFYDPLESDPSYTRPWKNTGKREGVLPDVVASKQVEFDEARWSAYVRFYEQRIERVDAELGRLLEELRCSGFYNNTWIIFCSDHGDMCGEHNLAFKGPYMYEGVVRVPLVIVPPQRRFLGADRTDTFVHELKPSRQDGLCSLIDIPPTILDLAGAAKPPEWEGTSLLPWVKGKPDQDPHETVYAAWAYPTINMVRSKEWKYIRFEDGQEELFNLEADPHESINHAGRVHSQATLEAFRSLVAEHNQTTQPLKSPGPSVKP